MTRRMILGLLALAGLAAGTAQAGWSVGVSLGVPGFHYHHHHRPHCYAPCYHPRPILVAPAPVIVQPVEVVQPVQVIRPKPLPMPQPVHPTYAPPLMQGNQDSDVSYYLQQLQDPDHRQRIEAATQLGRLRARQAVDPLLNCLHNDRSPQVREASARSLGQIGGNVALTGLQRAAANDGDRDVRYSASLAADVLRAQYKTP